MLLYTLFRLQDEMPAPDRAAAALRAALGAERVVHEAAPAALRRLYEAPPCEPHCADPGHYLGTSDRAALLRNVDCLGAYTVACKAEEPNDVALPSWVVAQLADAAATAASAWFASGEVVAADKSHVLFDLSVGAARGRARPARGPPITRRRVAPRRRRRGRGAGDEERSERPRALLWNAASPLGCLLKFLGVFALEAGSEDPALDDAAALEALSDRLAVHGAELSSDYEAGEAAARLEAARTLATRPCANPACVRATELDKATAKAEGGMNLSLCSACCAVRYCCREFQRADLRAHKVCCSEMRAEKEAQSAEGAAFWLLSCNFVSSRLTTRSFDRQLPRPFFARARRQLGLLTRLFSSV